MVLVSSVGYQAELKASGGFNKCDLVLRQFMLSRHADEVSSCRRAGM